MNGKKVNTPRDIAARKTNKQNDKMQTVKKAVF